MNAFKLQKRRSLQPSKDNMQFKNMKVIIFLFVGHFSMSPPGSKSDLDPDPIQIWIRIRLSFKKMIRVLGLYVPDPDLSDELLIQLGLRVVHGMGDQVDPVLRSIVLQNQQ